MAAHRFTPAFAALGLLLCCHAAASADDRSDPWFGEALFYAHQDRWFEALERLDAELAQHYRVDERALDSLYALLGEAEFSVGDFELRYRMHHRAGRAIRNVLEADVPDAVRNDAIHRLARLHWVAGRPEDALHVLDGLRGRLDAPLRDDVAFLRANLLLATDRPDEAVEVLDAVQSVDSLHGFADYNLGIAMLRAGHPEAAVAQLERAGRVSADDAATRAIRDKSNLVLGTLSFEAGEFEIAQRALDRVSLEGAFSNQALLRSGWSSASAGNHERALVPWSLLAEREATDVAVQEAWLALPHAYGELGVHGRAAHLYGRAVASLEAELEKVDASIASIREGMFLEALRRDEIRGDDEWVIHLRSLPNAPETYYLIDLIASHEFQTALQNYLDLEHLRRELTKGRGSLDAFDDLTALRADYFEPRLPGIDTRFRELDARMRLRLEQRASIEARLERLLVAPRPSLLATAAEQSASLRLEALESSLEASEVPADHPLRQRTARLRGLLVWSLETEYPERLTEAHRHLRELRTDVERLTERYEAFVRVRQAAPHGYSGYDAHIRGLRARIDEALERTETLATRQGELLESVAVEQLVARRALLEDYQNRARFAFADSYDRATKAQARIEVQ